MTVLCSDGATARWQHAESADTRESAAPAAWGCDSAFGEIGNSLASTTYDECMGTLENTMADSSLSLSLTPEALAMASYSMNESISYPRIISAMEMLGESDSESSVFCGTPSEPGNIGLSEIWSLAAWGLGAAGGHGADDDRANRDGRQSRDGHRSTFGENRENRQTRGDNGRWHGFENNEGRLPPDTRNETSSKRNHPVIQQRGDTEGDNQKYVGVFQIGLEDDEEFCLVKRILGKSGSNMRRIAEECNAKVRLRGMGSGFLEGSDGKEANMPLQLNVSCTDFESYVGAAERVASLLNELYKHYKRYVRSKGLDPPDVKLVFEEVRRDDLNIDLLSQKAQRSPSQRERDRRQRERERQQQKDREREKGGVDAENVQPKSSRRERSRERYTDERLADEDRDDDVRAKFVLPGGLPVPTTPAGRRAAARAGGAAAAAVVSAAAREAERIERGRIRAERDGERAKEREERDRKKREVAERNSTLNRPGRNGARSNPKASGNLLAAESESPAFVSESSRGASGKGGFGKGKGKGSVASAVTISGSTAFSAGHGVLEAPPPPLSPPPEGAVQVAHMQRSPVGYPAKDGKGKAAGKRP